MEQVSIPHRYAENSITYYTSFALQQEFQFLIGTLRTLDACCPKAADIRVSIPHRYAENIALLAGGSSKNMVSIPHRYAENLGAR